MWYYLLYAPLWTVKAWFHGGYWKSITRLDKLLLTASYQTNDKFRVPCLLLLPLYLSIFFRLEPASRAYVPSFSRIQTMASVLFCFSGGRSFNDSSAVHSSTVSRYVFLRVYNFLCDKDTFFFSFLAPAFLHFLALNFFNDRGTRQAFDRPGFGRVFSVE